VSGFQKVAPAMRSWLDGLLRLSGEYMNDTLLTFAGSGAHKDRVIAELWREVFDSVSAASSALSKIVFISEMNDE
jgi:hypothetical protein